MSVTPNKESKPKKRLKVWSRRIAAGVALVAICFAIVGARGGPRRWWVRYERMFDNAEHLIHVRGTPGLGAEDRMLAQVPAGARVAVWVEYPERVDYTAHEIIDLRTRRLDRVARLHEWWPEPRTRFEDLLASMKVQYLLVSEDNRRIARSAKSLMTRWLCRPNDSVAGEDPYRSRLPICLDALELVAATHRLVARADGLRLVDLTQREYVMTPAR